MTAEVDLCNRALSRLGTRATVASLAENSTEARTCAIWYAATRDALLRGFDWNFARRRATLADLGTPLSGWGYRYALPSDCVRVLRLASSALYEVAGNGEGGGRVLLTDEPAAEAIYTARVEDPARFDAGFAAALVEQLAANIAYPITQKSEVAQRLAQMARATLSEAAAADGNEGQAGAAATDFEPDSIAARA